MDCESYSSIKFCWVVFFFKVDRTVTKWNSWALGKGLGPQRFMLYILCASCVVFREVLIKIKILKLKF